MMRLGLPPTLTGGDNRRRACTCETCLRDVPDSPALPWPALLSISLRQFYTSTFLSGEIVVTSVLRMIGGLNRAICHELYLPVGSPNNMGYYHITIFIIKSNSEYCVL